MGSEVAAVSRRLLRVLPLALYAHGVVACCTPPPSVLACRSRVSEMPIC